MQEELRLNNITTLVGKIISDCKFSHQIYGEDFYTFEIEVSRLSDTFDKLPVTVSERLLDKNLFKVGAVIQVQGQIRSYNNLVDQRNHLVLTIFAKELNYMDFDSNQNPNLVTLNGFICKKPIYRKTPFGREICDILLAVNRSYNKSDYIPCIIWGRNAKFADTLEVSSNIKITGRMQSRVYSKKINVEDENATELVETIIEKTAYEISVSKLELVKKDNGSNLELSILPNSGGYSSNLDDDDAEVLISQDDNSNIIL
ncbi:MAG: single-stranded DNA-binding protein [bacterium]